MPTVLITGISGYIAKHTAAAFLSAGYDVRGSVRTMTKSDEVRMALASESADRLSFTELDLMNDDGWPEALEGVDLMVHMASPFPLGAPKTESDLIRPAVDGTRRALEAAHHAGVRRVILTSSVVAISGSTPRNDPFTESDWTDVDHPSVNAYGKSKTLAERAAWEITQSTPELELTTINPSFVVGAPLGTRYATSLELVKRILRAGDPALPRLRFSCVDVGDVAKAHLRAAERPEAIGRRFIVSSDAFWFSEMAELLQQAFPARKIVTRTAPNIAIKFLGVFDREVKQLVPLLGRQDSFDASRAKDLLGITFTDPRESLVDGARYLIEHDQL